jgi:hypothetical protein
MVARSVLLVLIFSGSLFVVPKKSTLAAALPALFHELLLGVLAITF